MLKVGPLLLDCREIAFELQGLAIQFFMEVKATGALEAMPGKEPEQAQAGTGDDTVEFGNAHGTGDFGGVA